MIDLKDVVKKERAKVQVKASAAAGPGSGKAPVELEKEILENHKAMLENAAKESRAKAAIEAKAAKESAKEDLIDESEIHTTKPAIPTHMECPFCGERKSIKGMNRHIAEIHEVPGVTVQDLNDVEEGLKSLPDLVAEKFEGQAMIAKLSPEIRKKEFSDWNDIKEDPEDPVEATAAKDNPGPPGNPKLKEDFIEKRKFNFIPYFSPFNRRRYRQ